MIVNRQRRVALKPSAFRAFLRRLRLMLELGRRAFDVCLVTDHAIKRLNRRFRGKAQATDVLAFAYDDLAMPAPAGSEWSNFLGDVVISAETARRSARAAGGACDEEICRLILHGALHLLGYDHETDAGEMAAVEQTLRRRLGIQGNVKDRW